MSAARSILFATTDVSELEQLEASLGEHADGWNLVRAENGAQALEWIDREAFDVVVADLDLIDLNGVEVLDTIWKSQPNTIRFLRARSVDQDLMMKCVWGTHRFIPKPSEPDLLKTAILRGLELDVWLNHANIRNLVSRMRTFPVLPSLYHKALRELESPNPSAAEVAAIIGQDLAMSTKLIQVVNSAFYGLKREITDLTETINILGTETVKALIVAIKTFALLDKVKPLYFSMDRIWRHGMAVAHLARRIAEAEGADAAQAGEAFHAGLFHDLGKIILAGNLGEHYDGALTLAKKRQIPPWEVEAEVFGACHAATGAYLLALWGMPTQVVEATGLHHDPNKVSHSGFSALTAVHVANALEHERNVGQQDFVSPAIDESYLREIGCLERLEFWRRLAAGAETPAMATAAPPPVTQPRPAVSRSMRTENKLAFWGATVGVTLLIVALFGAWRMANRAGPIPDERAEAFGHSAAPEPAAPTQVLNTEPPRPGEAENSSPVPDAQAAEALSAPAVVQPSPFPLLTLQGILYRPPHSLALINGKQVSVGNAIDGVEVVLIDADRVRVRFGSEERTLRVH